MQENTSIVFQKSLIDQCANLWLNDFEGDPILDPIGDATVAFAVGIGVEEMNSLIGSGLLPRTCSVEIMGQHRKYYCNYWDVLQTSAFFSLIAIGASFSLAYNFAEGLCDSLASRYEDKQLSEKISLDDLISIISFEIDDYLACPISMILKYRKDAVVVNVALNLINSSFRLARER